MSVFFFCTENSQNEPTFNSKNTLFADGEQANWTFLFHRSWYWIGYTGRVNIHSSTIWNQKQINYFLISIKCVLCPLTSLSGNSSIKMCLLNFIFLHLLQYISLRSESVNKNRKGALPTLRVYQYSL